MKHHITSSPMTLIGLMSGTSVDSVDGCCVRFSPGTSLDWEILGTHSLAIPADLKHQLIDCNPGHIKNSPSTDRPPLGLKALAHLNIQVGELFAQAAQELLQETGLDAKSIDAIGSHGQTLYHEPPSPENQGMGCTLQIGEPIVIAERTGIATVGNFRVRDMLVGGHGAPLVCLADQLLFQTPNLGRCIQNIGGIGNVTVLPPLGKGEPIAFDTGPGNMLIDGAMQQFFQQPMDRDGIIAVQGEILPEMLQALMAHPYLKERPPKTTGRELFGDPYLQQILQQFPAVEPKHVIATLTAFTAQSIIHSYETFIFPQQPIHEVIVGGGGVWNPTLMNTFKTGLAAHGIPVTTHAKYGIPDTYKEALAFAILAWYTLQGRPGNIPSCTGAKRPVVLGTIVP